MNTESAEPPAILVVEPSGLIALQLEELLTEAGYAVTRTVSISEALQAAGSMSFALALIDLPDEQGDGEALRSALAAQTCRVAFVTALPGDSASRALQFQKPIDPAAILRWVMEAETDTP